jgi:Predicted ATPases of PP-loop superfamily
MKNVIVSWSGGKDSAMSVYSIMNDPTFNLVGLLSIVFKYDDNKHYIGMHMIDIALIKQQSELMGVELFIIEYIDEKSYEKEMKFF